MVNSIVEESVNVETIKSKLESIHLRFHSQVQVSQNLSMEEMIKREISIHEDMIENLKIEGYVMVKNEKNKGYDFYIPQD